MAHYIAQSVWRTGGEGMNLKELWEKVVGPKPEDQTVRRARLATERDRHDRLELVCDGLRRIYDETAAKRERVIQLREELDNPQTAAGTPDPTEIDTAKDKLKAAEDELTTLENSKEVRERQARRRFPEEFSFL